MAMGSLVFGIMSWFFLLLEWASPAFGRLEGLVLVGIAAVLSILFGFFAIRKIGSTPTPVEGRRLAQAGLWLAFSSAVIVPSVWVAYGIFYPRTSAMGHITKALSNCRQIITVLRIYSSDQSGKYPDADLPSVRSSNEIFRQLFVAECIDTEMIFGCPMSVFVPDGRIGSKPKYLDALTAGENHWAFTKGLDDSSPGDIPLVFENPSDASWPPKWDPDLAGTKKPGRTWSNGKVIVGYNDSSIGTEATLTTTGKRIELRPKSGGAPVFPLGNPQLSILNVEK